MTINRKGWDCEKCLTPDNHFENPECLGCGLVWNEPPLTEKDVETINKVKLLNILERSTNEIAQALRELSSQGPYSILIRSK